MHVHLATARIIKEGAPQTRPLQNGFSRAYTEPTWGGLAATPGEVGIQAVVDATGTNVGYTINGFGKDEVIIVLSSGN